MQKTEVYSWRLSPRLKSELEEAARAERKSVAELLEQIAQDWLERARGGTGDEDERQQGLRRAAMSFVGSIEGGNPNRAENARAELRSRLARQHGR
jgi:hypothetical protein